MVYNISLMNQSKPTDAPTPEFHQDSMIAWLTTFVLVSFLIFASNLVTISTFWINRHLRRHSVYCLLNLAIADMVHGLCSIFWCLVYLDYLGMDLFTIKLNHHGMNLVAGLVNTCTLVLSLVSLLIVSIDRVVATFRPFTHRATTSKTYIRIFVVAWCTAFLLAALPSFYADWNMYGHDIWFSELDFLCMLSLVVIILSYIAIFIKIRLKNNHHQQHQQEHAIQIRHRRERHLAITLFIVTALSLMTWLPFIINHELELSASLEPGPTQHNIELFTELVQLTNSLINPIVYVFRMKEFRQALFHLVFKCSKVGHRRIHPSMSLQGDTWDAYPSTLTGSGRVRELGFASGSANAESTQQIIVVVEKKC